MFWKRMTAVCILIATISYAVAEFPKYIKRCKLDTKLSECLMENARSAIEYVTENNGDKSLNISNINNTTFPRLEFPFAKDLPLLLINTTITGWGGFKPFDASFADNVLQIKGHMDEFQIDGMYSMHGRLLMLAIEGEGNCHVVMKDFDVTLTTKLRTKKRDGKEYFYMDSHSTYTSVNIPHPASLTFVFNNLFRGDAALGLEMNKFINENWKDVYDSARPGLENIVGMIMSTYGINQLLDTTRIDELFE